MIKHLLVILAISIIIAGCIQTQNAGTVVNLGENFTLNPGQSASIPSEGLTFTFDKVLEDSRCPQGVQCFWAGQTTILVEAEKSGNSTSFEMTKKAGSIEPGTYDTKGYTFEFIDISPAKAQGQDISDERANVTFRIMKAG
jgi:hypothetical protein